MRLIDADKLTKRFKQLKGVDSLANMFITDVVKEIQGQPTVEAVPVVHCKDCKQWHKGIGWCDKHSHFINSDGSFCYPWESNDWKMFNENDFCSDGERIKDECVCKKDIKAVCSNDEARQYFKDKGLEYNKVTEGDILTLVMLLNKHIKKSNKECETSMGSMYLSKKVDMKRRTNGALLHCYLYVNSHYFERRECISFNPDGFIGFVGWADQGNTNPILRAFLEWCDLIAEQI